MRQLVYFPGRIKDLPRFFNLLYEIEGKIIAVDIDNTLINVNKELKKLGYDTNIYPNPEITEEFWLSEEGRKTLLNAEFIVSTVKIISSFTSLKTEIIFVTSRSVKLKPLTEAWAKKYFPEIEVYFTQKKHQVDADIYVEDDPSQIKEFINLSKIVLIPEWEYNKGLFEELNNVFYYHI